MDWNPGREVFRFCPRCGADGFGVQSHKRMGCAACGFTYYFNPCGAAAALILDRQGRLLLTRRGKEPAKGTLGLPGGFIDFGETVEKGLTREIREEVNIEVRELSYFCSFPNQYQYGGMLYHTIDLFYLARIEKIGEFTVTEEIPSYYFCDPAAISLEEIGMPSIRRAVERFFAERIAGGPGDVIESSRI